jgi:DNA-binding MarR family transcriptional regulator
MSEQNQTLTLAVVIPFYVVPFLRQVAAARKITVEKAAAVVLEEMAQKSPNAAPKPPREPPSIAELRRVMGCSPLEFWTVAKLATKSGYPTSTVTVGIRRLVQLGLARELRPELDPITRRPIRTYEATLAAVKLCVDDPLLDGEMRAYLAEHLHVRTEPPAGG